MCIPWVACACDDDDPILGIPPPRQRSRMVRSPTSSKAGKPPLRRAEQCASYITISPSLSQPEAVVVRSPRSEHRYHNHHRHQVTPPAPVPAAPAPTPATTPAADFIDGFRTGQAAVEEIQERIEAAKKLEEGRKICSSPARSPEIPQPTPQIPQQLQPPAEPLPPAAPPPQLPQPASPPNPPPRTNTHSPYSYIRRPPHRHRRHRHHSPTPTHSRSSSSSSVSLRSFEALRRRVNILTEQLGRLDGVVGARLGRLETWRGESERERGRERVERERERERERVERERERAERERERDRIERDRIERERLERERDLNWDGRVRRGRGWSLGPGMRRRGTVGRAEGVREVDREVDVEVERRNWEGGGLGLGIRGGRRR